MDKCETCGNYVCGHAREVAKPATSVKTRKQRKPNMRTAMLTQEIARTVPLIPAMNVGGQRKSRVHQTSSPCLVTRLDGTQYVLANTREGVKRLRDTGIEAYEHKHLTASDHRRIMANMPALLAD